ncbi:MAG TPA: hypothetical protein VIM13_01350 [Clostridia bacterium]
MSSFRVTGEPALEVEGRYAYGVLQGNAKISLFQDCLCILPPDLKARRIPFVSVNSVKNENYTLTVTLDTDEVYTFSMLGSDLDPLERAFTTQIRKQKENNIAFITPGAQTDGAGSKLINCAHPVIFPESWVIDK